MVKTYLQFYVMKFDTTNCSSLAFIVVSSRFTHQGMGGRGGRYFSKMSYLYPKFLILLLLFPIYYMDHMFILLKKKTTVLKTGIFGLTSFWLKLNGLQLSNPL